ncbi:MAG: TonB family protein [Bdellovibrionaceae bacterium]|nr:TonB family protein [Pseudobdellovibrionaceae bacterium]
MSSTPIAPHHTKKRHITGLSLSLFLHGSAGIAIALAPAPVLQNVQSLAEAVYIDSTEGLPQGEQIAALPAAEATPPVAAQVEAPVETPRAQSPPEVQKPEPPRTLPVKAAVHKAAPSASPNPPAASAASETQAPEVITSDDSELSVRSAVEQARKAKTTDLEGIESDTADENNERESPSEPTEPTALASANADRDDTSEESEEEASTVEHEESPVAPLQAEIKSESEPDRPQTPPSSPPTLTQPVSQPAPRTAPQYAQSVRSGTGTQKGPGGTGSTQPYGIRDASELHAAPGNRVPQYPERDRLMRNQGTTVFIARVRPDGTVTDIRMERSANSRSLDVAALDAMKKWRFLPGQQGLVRKGFTFSLEGDAEELPARLRR